MGLAFNDGGIKFVQQTITANDILGTQTTYIVEKGSLKAGANRVVSKDAFGNEIKQAGMTKIREGSLDLQFVNTADKPPARFQPITLLDTSGSNVNVILWEVDQDFGADAEAKLKVTIYEKMAVTPEAG